MQSALNHLGAQFLSFAWPMLWQSSLLIAVVFAVDFLLARKLRASVRHALWLIVFVKLLLPPTLALPTSAAWWLFPAKPIVIPAAISDTNPSALNTSVVVYDDAPPPDFTQDSVAQIEPPRPSLNRAGWTLLATGAVSVGLLFWLLLRWWQLTQKVRRATPADAFPQLLGAAMNWSAGLRPGSINRLLKRAGSETGAPTLHIRIIDARMSPAVCGLFRPVILLPRILTESLSAPQLRAVLLHEIIHLRRRDIWVNCAQSLLQILYWWHPLVWLANARIRQVREEAVDDAVMLALAADADTYAPTLLEVAKLAFRRPLMSLGIIGLISIIESRSALRQRIERLVNYHAPSKAGLTFLSFCAIFLFSAVALPMGQGPARIMLSPESYEPSVRVRVDNVNANGIGNTPFPQGTIQAGQAPTQQQMLDEINEHSRRGRQISTNVISSNLPPLVSVSAAFYQIPPQELDKMTADLSLRPADTNGDAWWSATPEEYSQLENTLTNSSFTLLNRPHIQTSSGNKAQMFIGNDIHGTALDCLPTVNDDQIDLDLHGKITDHTSIPATNQFTVKATSPNHGGVIVRFPNDTNNTVIFLNVKIVPAPRSASSGILTNPNFQTALRALHQRTGVETSGEPGVTVLPLRKENRAEIYPPRDPIEVNQSSSQNPGLSPIPPDDFVTNFDKGPTNEALNLPKLFMRTFKIEPSALRSGFENLSPQLGNSLTATNPSAMAKAFFTQLGVNLAFPPGKSIFYNDKLGYLFVKGTTDDLDTIERALQLLNQYPLQPTVTNNDNSVFDRMTSNTPPSHPVIRRNHLVFTGAGRQAIAAKLDHIHLDTVSYDGMPLTEVLKQLAGQIRVRDPEHKGINFLINNNPDLSGIDPNTGLPVTPTAGAPATTNEPPDVGSYIIKMPDLTNVRLADVLDAIVLVSDHPLKYSIQDFAIVFSAKGPETPQLFMRNFRIDPNTFYSGLEKLDQKSLGAVQPGTGGQDIHGLGDFDTTNSLQNVNGLAYITTQTSAATPSARARAYFATLGVNLLDPPGKSIFFNDKLGLLFVKATESDLDTIERALQVLNQTNHSQTSVSYPVGQSSLVVQPTPSKYSYPAPTLTIQSTIPPFPSGNPVPIRRAYPAFALPAFLTENQRAKERELMSQTLQNQNGLPPDIHIKTRFISVPKGTLANLEKYLNATNRTDGKPMGFLSANEEKAILKYLGVQKGIMTLSEPEITVTSGRQAQMRTMETITVITNLTFNESNGQNAIIPQTNSVEVGPIIDISPSTAADGFAINLTAIPSLKEFRGYDQPTLPQTNFTFTVQLPTVSPKFQTQQLIAHANLWDGQTLLLTGIEEHPILKPTPALGAIFSTTTPPASNAETNDLLVLITPTLVDPAGTRIHSATDLIALPPIPPQPE